MGYMGTYITVLVLTISFSATISTAQNFKCNSPAKCTALVGYPSANKTSIGDIQTLFNIKNLRSILGANNLPLTTLRNFSIEAKQVIKIPIPCVCTNNTGASYKIPVYKIKKDDGLYHIAQDVFSGLVQFPRIQAYNNITDPNLIIEGQNLTIPLPCSCDDVKGEKVVHYTHVVESGSSLESIAQQFGTDKDTLMDLNGIDDSQLKADNSIDVPLKACNSSIRNDSLDSSLLVANGTYVFTANNCVKCKCDAANNWMLQCEPSGIQIQGSDTCPSMLCEGSDSLFIGNTTSSACNQTTCAYAGFSSQTIFTTPVTTSTCPTPPPSNYASRIGSNWNFFIFIHLALFNLYLSH